MTTEAENAGELQKSLYGIGVNQPSAREVHAAMKNVTLSWFVRFMMI